MASTSSPEITPIIEPIVSPRNNDILPRSPSTSVLSMFLGLFAGRRGASMIVRENVAHQLESWREDWGYSLPVVVFDTVWNLMFVVAAIVILFLSVDEKPNVPLRVWIFGYVVQCFVHVVLLWLEFRKRNRIVSIEESLISSGSSSEEVDGDGTGRGFRFRDVVFGSPTRHSIVKVRIEDGKGLTQLTVAFLAIDMFFAAIGILLSLLVGLGVCFCFPCIIGIMYLIRRQEEVFRCDINVLPNTYLRVPMEQPECNFTAGWSLGKQMVQTSYVSVSLQARLFQALLEVNVILGSLRIDSCIDLGGYMISWTAGRNPNFLGFLTVWVTSLVMLTLLLFEYGFGCHDQFSDGMYVGISILSGSLKLHLWWKTWRLIILAEDDLVLYDEYEAPVIVLSEQVLNFVIFMISA
ncbi:hypothetical protein Tco_0588621 [Tanacetum coccineum]